MRACFTVAVLGHPCVTCVAHVLQLKVLVCLCLSHCVVMLYSVLK